MKALEAIDDDVREHILHASRCFDSLTPNQQKLKFDLRLRQAGLNLDTLSSDLRRLHALAQRAVIGFREVQKADPRLTIFDAVLVVLCDAHGGAHGTELTRSHEFNRILATYYP